LKKKQQIQLFLQSIENDSFSFQHIHQYYVLFCGNLRFQSHAGRRVTGKREKPWNGQRAADTGFTGRRT
jgi:hypothetical protein